MVIVSVIAYRDWRFPERHAIFEKTEDPLRLVVQAVFKNIKVSGRKVNILWEEVRVA
jgi:hypothetical protein